MSGRILVVQLGGIGDLMLACPALEALGREGPVEVCGRPDRLALLVAGGIAEAAYDADAVGLDSAFAAPNERFRAFASRFARAVLWMRDAAPLVEALHASGVADVRAFPGLPPDGWKGHASAYYLGCLGYGKGRPFRMQVSPGPQVHDVVIHPGSGGARKNWPLAHFRKVAAALAEKGCRVRWLLGPAEEGFVLPEDSVRLNAASLVDLAGQLAATGLYIGNDSGVTHLAAAVGCRVTAVFGPTDPEVWAPRGGNVRVVRGDPWPRVGQVIAAAQADAEALKSGGKNRHRGREAKVEKRADENPRSGPEGV
jgi:heptosyltransferase III